MCEGIIVLGMKITSLPPFTDVWQKVLSLTLMEAREKSLGCFCIVLTNLETDLELFALTYLLTELP